MPTKRKGPFGGHQHRGQFGKGGKRRPAPTHDIAPAEQPFNNDNDNVTAMPPSGGTGGMRGSALMPPPDYDEGM